MEFGDIHSLSGVSNRPRYQRRSSDGCGDNRRAE
ncbi:hypothetical protein M2351_007196 [Azospirillum canadense]|nr:hypothetical protein [Azospirillum canadense]